MKNMKQLLSGMLAMLTVLMMAGCMGDADPVRVSLDIDASDLVLNIGETSTRVGSSKAADSHFTYRTDNPSVATVDEDGEVTARSIGEATITVHMDENRTDWYAATDRSYRVVVKSPSAEILRRYDRDTPLTFVALEDGKITISFNNGITLSEDIIYTINAGYDKIIPKNTQGSYDIVVKKNDFVQLFSENDALSSGITAGARGTTRAVADGAKYINIKPAMKTEIYGNVMSMLEGEFFDDDCEIDADFALYGLFAGAEKLVNNPFRHIELPAYELRDGCYQAMFYGCKGLQRAPDLPAGAVTGFCYKEMFAGCSKLSYLKCLADDISADDCTKDWLTGAGTEATDGKTLATTFPFPENSNDGVPAGWTNEQLYPVKSVTLNKTSLEMIAGSAETGTATLTADVGPEYASDKTLFWLTSNEKVATVDDDGKVTAVGSGEAKITATAGGKTATCTVKVTVLVTGITLDETELDLTVDDDPVTLVAKVTPEGATDKTVTWSSSNDRVATVDANGKVKAVGNGEAKITAKAGDKTATCKVLVSTLASGVTLDKTELTLKIEDSPVTLVAKVTPASTSDKTVTWRSSNEKVATVDSNGKITPVGLGETKITAEANGYTATCTVKVIELVSSITLDKTDLSLNACLPTATLTATVKSDPSYVKGVSWSSGDKKVATVDANGKVTAVGSGTTTITATAYNKSATCKVTVATGGVALSKATVGMVICEHGKAYEATTGNLACGGKKVAVVAYKGAAGSADTSKDASGYVGLAIAMADASNGCLWAADKYGTCIRNGCTDDFKTAIGKTGDFGKGIDNSFRLATGACGTSSDRHNHPAARAAVDYRVTVAPPTGTSQWFLPTLYQWNLMLKGMCGDHGDVSRTDNSSYKAEQFSKKITAAGGTALEPKSYWSSVECEWMANAWLMQFGDGKVENRSKSSSSNTFNVRAVLAF